MSSWHRPLTRIYNDNHKFGTSLYSDALDDIEKRYKSSLRNTSFRSDRPDLQSPTIYQNSSIGSGGPVCETQGLTSRPRRDRPASMYVESSTTSAGAGATHLSSSSSVFEKELRQLNSKSTWDLRESRLQVDKGTAQRHARRTAPHSLYTNCRYMDSIFVGPRGFRIFD